MTGKQRVDGKWSEEKLIQEIEEIESNMKEETVKEVPKHELVVKGNKTDNLPEGHLLKDYSFKNDFANRGRPARPEMGLYYPVEPVYINQWLHVYLVPVQGDKRHDSPRDPYITKMDMQTYQNWSNSTSVKDFEEVIILHDPR